MKTLIARSLLRLPIKLPMVLTLGRLVVSPLFYVVYIHYAALGLKFAHVPFVLLGLLTLSELSDFLDGYLARKLDHVTKLGKILDPMADSVTRITMLLTFTQGPVALPLILIFAFIYRDAMISILRIVCGLSGTALAARKSGKLKAVIQAASVYMIVALLIPYSMGAIALSQLQYISLVIVSCSAVYTLFSGGEYLWAHWGALKDSWSKDK